MLAVGGGVIGPRGADVPVLTVLDAAGALLPLSGVAEGGMTTLDDAGVLPPIPEVTLPWLPLEEPRLAGRSLDPEMLVGTPSLKLTLSGDGGTGGDSGDDPELMTLDDLPWLALDKPGSWAGLPDIDVLGGRLSPGAVVGRAKLLGGEVSRAEGSDDPGLAGLEIPKGRPLLWLGPDKPRLPAAELPELRIFGGNLLAEPVNIGDDMFGTVADGNPKFGTAEDTGTLPPLPGALTDDKPSVPKVEMVPLTDCIVLSAPTEGLRFRSVAETFPTFEV